MAFRFGGKILAAGADQVLRKAPRTQIRGYCQNVSPSSELTSRGRVIIFSSGAVTSLAICYLVLHPMLEQAREERDAFIKNWGPPPKQ